MKGSLLLAFVFTFRALFDFNEEANTKLGLDDAFEAVNNSYFGPPKQAGT